MSRSGSDEGALPSIAVIMTSYNAEATVAGSLASALDQDYDGKIRFVVVDDGSTDRTVEVIRAIGDDRIELYTPARQGRAKALNMAIELASGCELIANLDADDFMLPGRLQKQAQTFAEEPDLGVLGSAYLQAHFTNSGTLEGVFTVSPPTSADAMRAAMATNFPICHSCATYRREPAVAAGLFDDSLRARLDFDLWLRIAAQGLSVRNLDEVLGVHIKRTGTYFDRQHSRVRSAREMARLNFHAARWLGLGIKGYVLATARFGYSLTRGSSVKGHPRFSVLSHPDRTVDVQALTASWIRFDESA